MDISVQEIAQRLSSNFGYKAQSAEKSANKVLICAPVVQKAFEQWWRDGSLDPALEAHGYTLKRLIDEYAFNPVNAMLTIDWILREPDMALAALEEGYDTIK